MVGGELRAKMLNGNLWRLALGFSWPAVIAMVLYGMNMVFDAIFVGCWVGEEALAGLSIAYPVVSLGMGMGSLIGIGAGSVLSVALGKKEADKASEKVDDCRCLLGNVNSMVVVLAGAYMLLAWLFGPQLIALMGGASEGAVLELSLQYFHVTVLGAVFWIYGFASNMLVRAEGKMKLAALMMGIGLLANIGFNALFIVGLDMGLKGASWGTNLGMMVYSLLGLLYFCSNKVSFPAKPFQFEWDGKLVSSIVSLGMASFIMVVMGLVQAIVVFHSLSRYGTVLDMAVYGAAFRIYSLLLMPMAGFMRALQPIVGINYGAGKMDRVVKAFWVFVGISTVLILPVWFGLMWFAGDVLALMIDPELLTGGHANDFRILLGATPVVPLLFMVMSFYPAINKGKPASLLGLFRQVVFCVPAMLLLPAYFGVKWVYIGSTVIDYLIGVFALVLVWMELRRVAGESGHVAEEKGKFVGNQDELLGQA